MHYVPVAAEPGPNQKMYGAGVVAMTVRLDFIFQVVANILFPSSSIQALSERHG